jgi:UDP-galactopyranose mutase
MKQWGRDPRELPAFIIQRLPFRTNYEESYYFDPWQGLPEDGYTAWIGNMLKSPLIEVFLDMDYMDIQNEILETCLVVYTGMLDRLFNYRLGHLDGRSLRFERETMDIEDYQGTPVMNYADTDVPFTRIHEPRHLHPERDYNRKATVIVREYPRKPEADGMYYYPVNTPRNDKLAEHYRKLTEGVPNMLLGGRLAEYCYYDMDQAIAEAMDLFEDRVKIWTADLGGA